jgi:hypothetical protein
MKAEVGIVCGIRRQPVAFIHQLVEQIRSIATGRFQRATGVEDFHGVGVLRQRAPILRGEPGPLRMRYANKRARRPRPRREFLARLPGRGWRSVQSGRRQECAKARHDCWRAREALRRAAS